MNSQQEKQQKQEIDRLLSAIYHGCNRISSLSIANPIAKSQANRTAADTTRLRLLIEQQRRKDANKK